MSSSTPRRSHESAQSPLASPSFATPSSRFRPQWSSHATSQGTTNARFPQRRGSAASIASSVGGTLDTATSDTNTQATYNPQNAISTLLSPTIVRTGLVPHSSLPAPSGHRPPSTRDIPAVTLTPIPHVEPSAFREYLSQVGPVFEAFSRAKAADEEASTPRPSALSRPGNEDEFAAVFGRHMQQNASTPPASPTHSRRSGAIASLRSPDARRGSSFGSSRRVANVPTPLSSIPNVYFDEGFRLENPRTFDVVSENAEIVPSNRDAAKQDEMGANGSARQPRRRALHTNAILQEKLSWYMDTVEVHLIASIAAASTSFFAALGSLKELQGEAEKSIDQIRNLRAALQQLDSQMAMGGLNIVNKRQRRENLRKLGQAVTQVCEVVEKAKRCELLVEEGDHEAATSDISQLERFIAGEPQERDGETLGSSPTTSPLDLRQLEALTGITEGIAQLRVRIGRGYEDKFKESLLYDMRQHVSTVPAKDTLQRWANASFRSRPRHTRKLSRPPAFLEPNEQLRSELTAALAGLSKAGQTARAATAYREAVMREIKSMLRQHLPSSNDDEVDSTTSASTRGGRKLTQQEKSSILARNLRSLDAEATEDLLVKVYTSVGEALRRLGYQVKTILDVTSTMEPFGAGSRNSDDMGPRPTLQATHIQDEVTQALDLSSLLGQAVDAVQGQIVKILKVRREENIHLPLPHFLRYFVLNRLFVDECEAVSSRSGDLLKEVVNSQIKDFVNVVAEREKQTIRRTLEEDRWEAKDFDADGTVALERVLEGVASTPRAWTNYVALWDETQPMQLSSNGTIINGDVRANSKVRSATIDEQRYILVNSAQSALHGIDTFAHLLAAIPAVTSDTASHLLAYLKLFNSTACQLILGAGATRSAGLKNITSKHLALASQACSFVVALLPYVRELVRRHLPASTANNATVLAEFDRVKRLFQDHQTSIHDKLVEIMSARSAAHVSAFRKIDFDTLTTQSGEIPSKPVEDLCKETGTLHRVLSRHVSELDLKMIMLPIFAAYKEEWSRALQEVTITTAVGKQRLLADVEALSTRLSKLDDSSDVGQVLQPIVQAKLAGNETPSTSNAIRSDPRPTSPPATKVAATNADDNTAVSTNDTTGPTATATSMLHATVAEEQPIAENAGDEKNDGAKPADPEVKQEVDRKE